MIYQDVERFGLLGLLPAHKKTKLVTKKDISIAKNAILNNSAFIQFALEEENADYINDILGELIDWVIVCNQAYNYYNKRA